MCSYEHDRHAADPSDGLIQASREAVTETGDQNLEVTGPGRGVPVAEWSQPGSTFWLYDDGTLVCERWTPAGREVLKDSIIGATARVESFKTSRPAGVQRSHTSVPSSYLSLIHI